MGGKEASSKRRKKKQEEGRRSKRSTWGKKQEARSKKQEARSKPGVSCFLRQEKDAVENPVFMLFLALFPYDKVSTNVMFKTFDFLIDRFLNIKKGQRKKKKKKKSLILIKLIFL